MVLAGGTGGAMLAAGIQAQSPGDRLTVIANTADDDEFWGLLVCPDIDAVIYRLAGVFNEAAGYGVRDDTFHVLDTLSRAGDQAWFRIGDRDFATHLLRAELMRGGSTLTQASVQLCGRFGISANVIPVTDDRVRTRFATDRGELSFQEYYVREHLGPRLNGIAFEGIDKARPTREVLEALSTADLVIIGPSNPLISIGPILEVVRSFVPRERTLAVTPIVGGVALKGPTAQMMSAMGHDPTPVVVARMYRDVADRFVLDSRDEEQARDIENLGYRVVLGDTVMRDGGKGLAAAILTSV